jgi:hypothetical protein
MNAEQTQLVNTEENSRVVYSLCVEDIQNVATEELYRTLTDGELEVVEGHLGDYINWYEIIETVIRIHIARR